MSRRWLGFMGAVIMASATAWGANFGYSGSRGYDGRDGSSGRSGEDIRIFADGNFDSHDLSGEDGLRGGDGSYGRSASGCTQPYRVPYNLLGASGGRGGDGGRGGHGGRGGDVTIFYDDLQDLANLEIVSIGGAPGRGGYGELGGEGCRCRVLNWGVENCRHVRRHDGSYERVCHTDYYRCTDGRRGRDGYDGRRGTRGRDGSLLLVKGVDELPNTNPSISTTLGSWAENDKLLSKLRFSTKSGASELLAPGSHVQDSFNEYEGVYTKNLRLDWQAERSLDSFSRIPVSLSVEGRYPHEKTNVSLPSTFWHKARVTNRNGIKTYIVTHALEKTDAAKLVFSHIRNYGRNFEVVLEDRSGAEAEIASSFHIEFQRKFIGYSTKFKGNFPQNLVERDGNQVILKLGQLPIKKKYFKDGKKFKLSLTAYRSWEGYRTDFVMMTERKFEIPED